MKKILVTLAAAGLGLVALAALTGFRHGGWHRGHSPEQVNAFVTDRLEDALDDLDATDAQRQQILAVKDRLLADGLAAREGHGQVKQELLAQWKSDRPDAARLHALVDARVDAMRALAHQAVDTGVEVHGILTPEQRAQLARKAERRMNR